MTIIDTLESEVRSYCRSWPATFTTARGATLRDDTGREYIDFFAGAGALNYGHNDPRLIEPLIEYIRGAGVLHSLDMITEAKVRFLETLQEVVLGPRGLDYRVQFPGPTGTNAVEAALKLARKVTGRQEVVGFTNAFHGMTLGSLAVTGNAMKREGAGVPLTHGIAMPFEGFLPDEGDTIAYLESFLDGSSSGVDHPAAVIVETVQAEGGINAASDDWLRNLADLCRRFQVLLIIDDIQVGCGRTGPFFSFERAGVVPDILTLSKSLSGAGLPFALTLFRPDLDVWEPGEHNGTFRGNNAAMVTARAALDVYWRDDALRRTVGEKSDRIAQALGGLREAYPHAFGPPRGRGMIQGLPCIDPALSDRIVTAAFERGLIVETSGPQSEVVKILPPLTIDDGLLHEGLERLGAAVEAAVGAAPAVAAAGH